MLSHNERSPLQQSYTGAWLCCFELLIILKNYSGTEILNESWFFVRVDLNLMGNLQTWFRAFFGESDFLELIFLRSQNLTEVPLYRISLLFLLPSSVQSVLISGESIFKTCYNTVSGETKESWFDAWNCCIKTMNNSGSIFPLLSWSPKKNVTTLPVLDRPASVDLA